jgi:hypothetical protein
MVWKVEEQFLDANKRHVEVILVEVLELSSVISAWRAAGFAAKMERHERDIVAVRHRR